MEKHGSESYLVLGEGLPKKSAGGHERTQSATVKDAAPPFASLRREPEGHHRGRHQSPLGARASLPQLLRRSCRPEVRIEFHRTCLKVGRTHLGPDQAGSNFGDSTDSYEGRTRHCQLPGQPAARERGGEINV